MPKLAILATIEVAPGRKKSYCPFSWRTGRDACAMSPVRSNSKSYGHAMERIRG